MTVAPYEVEHRLGALAQDARRGEDERVALEPELRCRTKTMGLEDGGVGGRWD